MTAALEQLDNTVVEHRGGVVIHPRLWIEAKAALNALPGGFAVDGTHYDGVPIHRRNIKDEKSSPTIIGVDSERELYEVLAEWGSDHRKEVRVFERDGMRVFIDMKALATEGL